VPEGEEKKGTIERKKNKEEILPYTEEKKEPIAGTGNRDKQARTGGGGGPQALRGELLCVVTKDRKNSLGGQHTIHTTGFVAQNVWGGKR